MTNEKHFSKTISQWEFDYGLFTNLPRIIVARDFSPSSFKRYPTSLDKTRTYPDLKTTCHIKLKFFLWTKLLENLVLAKYLISFAAPLNEASWFSLICDFWPQATASHRTNSNSEAYSCWFHNWEDWSHLD